MRVHQNTVLANVSFLVILGYCGRSCSAAANVCPALPWKEAVLIWLCCAPFTRHPTQRCIATLKVQTKIQIYTGFIYCGRVTYQRVVAIV